MEQQPGDAERGMPGTHGASLRMSRPLVLMHTVDSGHMLLVAWLARSKQGERPRGTMRNSRDGGGNSCGGGGGGSSSSSSSSSSGSDAKDSSSDSSDDDGDSCCNETCRGAFMRLLLRDGDAGGQQQGSGAGPAPTDSGARAAVPSQLLWASSDTQGGAPVADLDVGCEGWPSWLPPRVRVVLAAIRAAPEDVVCPEEVGALLGLMQVCVEQSGRVCKFCGEMKRAMTAACCSQQLCSCAPRLLGSG
jgi:hypothetical protein